MQLSWLEAIGAFLIVLTMGGIAVRWMKGWLPGFVAFGVLYFILCQFPDPVGSIAQIPWDATLGGWYAANQGSLTSTSSR